MIRSILTSAVLIPLMAAAPTRVVSTNPCLDVDLLSLADRSQIVALSHYARNPEESSVPRDIGAVIPITHETAEEIVLLHPDLVLASAHTQLATRRILQRLGVRLVTFDVPETIEDNYLQIRKIAAVLGHEDRGEALIAGISEALAADAPAPGSAPVSALIYQPNGFSVGRGTLSDAVMASVGLVNAAARYTRRKADNVPLELVVADPPQLLLIGAGKDDWSWAARLLHHPALQRLPVVRAYYPQRLMNCGGPVLIETADALARARESVHP